MTSHRREAALWERERTALKPPLLWKEGRLAYFTKWDLTLTLCELQIYYKGTDLHKLNVQVVMVRNVYSSHTTMVALLLTNKSLCLLASVTDQIHKVSARRCLALLNAKCFVPLFVGRKFLPDYPLSLILASITAEPTLFSTHRFSFLFLLFLFLAPAACPHHKNNHMICHQNCHFLSRVKPVHRGRNELCHRTWEKPLGCNRWVCCRMQQNTIIKSDEMRLAATLSSQLPGLGLRQEQLHLWQSSHICLAYS